MAQQCEQLKTDFSLKLNELENDLISRDFVECIGVTSGSNSAPQLDTQIFASQVIHRELQKVEDRIGQTFHHGWSPHFILQTRGAADRPLKWKGFLH